MARINAYPFITTIADSDSWIGTKASNGATKQFTAADVLAYVNGAQNRGTIDTIGVFKTTRELYTPVNTTAISGKSFVQKISQTNATIELGATDTTFTTINEGVKIYPNTTHYTTRVLPWLEVFSYEDPTLNPDNTYDSNYNGSAIVVGKGNTIGDGNSSNLGIIGFNNTLKGDKMMVVGQGNTTGSSNVSSLLVGTTNSLPDTSRLVNSLLVGQNNTSTVISAVVDTSIIAGRAHELNGNINRTIVAGDSNTVISADNSLVGGNNSTVRGDTSLVIGTGHGINVAAGDVPLVDSLIVGSTHTTTGTNTRLAVCGTTNQSIGPTQNCFIAGTGNKVYENNNSFIAGGSANQIGVVGLGSNGTSNFIGGGFSNRIGTGVGSTGNTSCFILGRSNGVYGTVGGAIGASNSVYSSTSGGNALAIGNQNTIGNGSLSPGNRPRNAIAIGTANNIQTDYTIQIGRGLDDVTTGGGEYVMVGRNNDQNNDYDLSALDVSFIVGASDQGAANARRNALVITNKSSGSNESNVILPGVGKYRNYATEAAAIAGGVPLYGLYRSGNDLKINFNETAGGGNEGLTILTPYFQLATPGGSATYTQLNNIVDFNWSGGSGTYEYILPSATAIPYRTIRFVNDSTITASDKIHITAPSGETIDGGAFYEINKPYNGCAVWSDGVQWIVIQAKA